MFPFVPKCPECNGEMHEAQATSFGEKYWWCRVCKKELKEMTPKRGLVDDYDYYSNVTMHAPPTPPDEVPSTDSGQAYPVPIVYTQYTHGSTGAAIPDIYAAPPLKKKVGAALPTTDDLDDELQKAFDALSGIDIDKMLTEIDDEEIDE